MKYNMELTGLSTENTKLKANLESERTTREKLESEVCNVFLKQLYMTN